MCNKPVCFPGAKNKFEGLSNLADYPILINRTRVLTIEHLYQALKFTDHPNIQREILKQDNPTRSKRVATSKNYKQHIRADWEEIKLDVMDYCLRIKLVWHWVGFGQLLEQTGDLDIIHISNQRDRFWGAVPVENGFDGQNNLGQLLKALRGQYINQEGNQHLHRVEAPQGLNILFLDEEISPVDRTKHLLSRGTQTTNYVNQFRV